jgi:hypothetical protein
MYLLAFLRKELYQRASLAPIRTPARATDPLGTDQFLVMRAFFRNFLHPENWCANCEF